MARARNIKPGFYKNEDLAECSVWARYIFPGLWMLADREGRLEDRPKRIKGELLPFDAQDVEPLLRELATRGFIQRYQVDGASFIQISKFKEHQSPHYSEKKSAIKGPELPESSPHIGAPDSRSNTVIKDGGNGRTPFLTPPDSLNPESRFSDSPNPDPGKKRSASASRSPRKAEPARTNPCWQAYSEAYTQRYGVSPTDNAKVRGMLAKLLERVPVDEAPQIAGFYVRSQRGLYVSSKHCIDLLLRDAEGLRTEWATGHAGTDAEARNADRAAATGNAFGKLIQEAHG